MGHGSGGGTTSGGGVVWFGAGAGGFGGSGGSGGGGGSGAGGVGGGDGSPRLTGPGGSGRSQTAAGGGAGTSGGRTNRRRRRRRRCQRYRPYSQSVSAIIRVVQTIALFNFLVGLSQPRIEIHAKAVYYSNYYTVTPDGEMVGETERDSDGGGTARLRRTTLDYTIHTIAAFCCCSALQIHVFGPCYGHMAAYNVIV